MTVRGPVSQAYKTTELQDQEVLIVKHEESSMKNNHDNHRLQGCDTVRSDISIRMF